MDASKNRRSLLGITIASQDGTSKEKPLRRDKALRRLPSPLPPGLWHALYLSALIALIAGCVAFWAYSRFRHVHYSYVNAYYAQAYGKEFTFLWTLMGTILSNITVILFKQVLMLTARQEVQGPGVSIGRIEFWSKLSTQKVLVDFGRPRLLLSSTTLLFAITTGLLTSAYTGLITPQQVYFHEHLIGTELDLASPAFARWYQNNQDIANGTCEFLTYGNSSDAISLSTCPYIQDPLPMVSAGLAALSAYLDVYATLSIIGNAFLGKLPPNSLFCLQGIHYTHLSLSDDLWLLAHWLGRPTALQYH